MWPERLAKRLIGIEPRACLRAFLADQRGASIIIIGLTLPVLVGAMGLAAEAGYWRQQYRSMQSAADAAAIAAATNGAATYASEAKAWPPSTAFRTETDKSR
jgi:Flp pilus assembly protein TadG